MSDFCFRLQRGNALIKRYATWWNKTHHLYKTVVFRGCTKRDDAARQRTVSFRVHKQIINGRIGPPSPGWNKIYFILQPRRRLDDMGSARTLKNRWKLEPFKWMHFDFFIQNVIERNGGKWVHFFYSLYSSGCGSPRALSVVRLYSWILDLGPHAFAWHCIAKRILFWFKCTRMCLALYYQLNIYHVKKRAYLSRSLRNLWRAY